MPKAPSIEELLKKRTPSGGSGVVSDTGPARAKSAAAASSTAKPYVHHDLTAEEQLQEKMEQIRIANLEKMAQTEAATHSLPYVNLSGFPITPEALALIPREESLEKRIVCFLQIGDELRFATTRPGPEALGIMERVTKREHASGSMYFISDTSYHAAEKLYDALPETRTVSFGYRI